MASNKNIPQGANEPDKRKSVQSDAADVDWMIMSDISTRISGSPEIRSSPNQSPAKSTLPISSNPDANDDLEDLEFLRSIGLDEEIERPSLSRNTANTSGSLGSKDPNNNEVNNIDWLIVTDLNVRKENAEIKAQSNPSYLDIGQSQIPLQPLTDNMMDGLDDDLGLDLEGLDFLENSDFADLDSLGLSLSDSLSINELQNEVDNTEGKIQGLAELLDDNDDSSFDLIAGDENDDWDSISGIFENDFNQLSSEPNLGISTESSKIPAQVSDIFGAAEETSGNIDLGSDLFYESSDQEDLSIGDLEFPDEIQSADLVEDFEISNDFQSEFQNELQNAQDRDLSFNALEIGGLELGFGNNLDDDFVTAQSLESVESSATEDEFWSNTSSNIDSESVLDESVNNTFNSDWGEVAENAIDDAVWDTNSSLATDLLSSTSIDNAFGTSSDWESFSVTDQPEVEEYASLELANVDSSLESVESESELELESELSPQPEPILEQFFDQIDNELEAEIRHDENWIPSIEDNDISVGVVGTETIWDSLLEEDEVIVSNLDEKDDWSASLEAEISNGNDVVWDEALVESEDYLPPAEESLELFNDNLSGLVDSGITEQPFPEDYDFGDNFDANGWAIAPHVNNLPESLSESEDVNVETTEIYGDFNDISENIYIPEQIADQQQFADFDEFIDPSLDGIESSLEGGGFDFSENSISPSSDWENLSEPIERVTDPDFTSYAESFSVEQFTDLSLVDNFASYSDSIAAESDLADDYADYADSFADESGLTDDYADSLGNDIVPPAKVNLGSSNWDASITEANAFSSGEANNLGSMLDENFDLATFDEDSLMEVPNSDLNLSNISTTLTPSRSSAGTFLEDSLDSGFTPQQSSINFIDSFEDNVVSPSDPFEEALVNDLLNENYEKLNFEEEALAHDLLNGLVSESDDFMPAKESPTMPTPMPTPNSNIAVSPKFDLGTSDDFLDDFDLESIDPLDDSGFSDGFVSAQISTGLTPSAPPIATSPPSLPPIAKQEPTSPSINNLPPPPPFLPPLPPKRNPNQANTAPAYPSPNVDARPLPQNRMGRRSEEDDFDRFHDQPQHRNNNKPIGSIDEAWSDLLDADTVLSGVRSSAGSSYSDISSMTPPSAGKSANRSSQGRERKDRNSSNVARRKETGLPDFNDLGLEVHDDNTDWSGLLDSGDLSDNITTISPQNTQMPSRIRTNPVTDSRSDMTGVSETREIPRDRKPMASFGDSTQARMSAPPDQIDFNRFTEDNYDSYNAYEQTDPSPIKTSIKPKLTIPSISLESLWQNYLKIPVIGLGAIGGVFLLYTFLNRPIFDLGLRWGLFKDASGKDFSKADFKGAKLDGVDFSKAILTEAKMQEASLVGANFQGANLDGVNFTKANLSGARLIQASVIWAEFNNAQMNLVDLAGADLTHSNFANAKMEGANLKGSKIGAQGTEKATIFSSTTLLAWQIVNEPREGRNLADQDLSGLNLSFTNLKRANLTNVKLNYTDMTNTDLSGANLSGGQINGTNWSGAKLNGINLTGITFDKSKLPKTDAETICPNGKKGPCKF
jgi:uncharacterized protein YjbI with pentapeptide repeats